MLTVATWNLENLFRPGEEGGPSSREAYEAELSALAGTINEVRPDVLVVQEVGSPAALEDLRERLDGVWERPVFGEPGGPPDPRRRALALAAAGRHRGARVCGRD